MLNDGNPDVIREVADLFRPRLEEGIPEAELVKAAKAREVWPFQVMNELGASLQGGIFLRKPAPPPAPAKPAPQPEPEPEEEEETPPVKVERVQAAAQVIRGPAPAPAPARSPQPKAQKPGQRIARPSASTSGSWEERLAFLDGAEGDKAQISIQEMQDQGWPSSAWIHGAFWSPAKGAFSTTYTGMTVRVALPI